MSLLALKKELKRNANPSKARILQGFFKTGPGEYGEGDVFLGIVVPLQRKIAQKYLNLTFAEVENLLASNIHEHRFIALVILVQQYKKGDARQKEKIARFFLKNRKHVNNWDLVDTATPHILGDYLLERDKSILYFLSRSRYVWDRRISILATFCFINKGRFEDTLALAEILLRDSHDLIQKAVGWALREVGKRSRKTEENFLQKHYRVMPRTMLRYAIERFSKKKREFYLK